MSGCSGLTSSTGWLGRPEPRSRRARFISMSGSLATMQAGELVRRLVTRTSNTSSPRSSLSLPVSPANSVLALSCACFSASSDSPPRSAAPWATDCSRLPSNSGRLATTQLSTASLSSSTSTPLVRNASRCGLLAAAGPGASR